MTAVNRADLLERKGLYPPPPGTNGVLGLEAAGEVIEIGSAVPSSLKIGDRVMALLSGGGYAEYVKVPANHVMKIPDGMGWEDAGAIPEVWLTAFQLVHVVGRMRAGDVVLVHAGSSGVGTAATQIISQFGGKSIVTAGSDDKLQLCKLLSADHLINYKTEEQGRQLSSHRFAFHSPYL